MTWLVILAIVLPFGLATWLGAPYVPIRRRDSEPILDLLALSPGQTVVDLGSGDGRFLLAAARRGLRGIGYELNPFMYLISRVITWRYRHSVHIYLANFWQVRLPATDAIYVFLIDRLMTRLDAKLTTELSQPTPVVSFVFAIPGRQPKRQTRNAFYYLYPGVKAPH